MSDHHYREQHEIDGVFLGGIALAVVVVLLESWGRRRFGSPWAARLGIPLPRAELIAHDYGAPHPIPADWLAGHPPIGPEKWLVRISGFAFGIVSVRREGRFLVFTMKRRLPTSALAFFLAIVAVVPHTGQSWQARLTFVLLAALTCAELEREYRRLGAELRELVGRVESLSRSRGGSSSEC